MTREQIYEEADSCFRRNLPSNIDSIPYSTQFVSDFLIKNNVNGKLLEVGCCWGYNLAYFTEKNGVAAYGIEPSEEAIKYGVYRHESLIKCGGAYEARSVG